MVETFEFDKRSGVDLPNEKVSHTPKYYKPYVEKRDGGNGMTSKLFSLLSDR
ncbi:MAG: hypothetical protein WKF71_04655 [Pyrinomonadaceae bacterium]